jgi:hypothetical protein
MLQKSHTLFFESQLQSVLDVIAYYQDDIKQVMRIIVQSDNFKKIRKVIQQSIGKWNAMLDPSHTRVSGFPSLVSILSNVYSESETSQFNGSIDSLLSLDLTAFTIFQPQTPTKVIPKEPITEVTLESYKTTIEMQKKKIGMQEAQIEFLINTIQQSNSDMNHKFERMLHLIAHKPTEQTQLEVETLESHQSNCSNNSATVSKPKLITQTTKNRKQCKESEALIIIEIV